MNVHRWWCFVNHVSHSEAEIYSDRERHEVMLVDGALALRADNSVLSLLFALDRRLRRAFNVHIMENAYNLGRT